MRALYDQVFDDYMKRKDAGLISKSKSITTVPTVVHIIKPNLSTVNEAEGAEQEQIDVLNLAFANNNVPFFFDLIEVQTHINSQWWSNGGNFKPQTRVGDMDTLNIWYNQPSGGLLGYATFPENGYNPEDGVVCLHTSVDGGSISNYNQGDTLVSHFVLFV